MDLLKRKLQLFSQVKAANYVVFVLRINCQATTLRRDIVATAFKLRQLLIVFVHHIVISSSYNLLLLF